MTCECVAKPTCQQGKHTRTDFIENSSKSEPMVVGESINQLDEAAAFGEKSQEHQPYSKAEVETDGVKQMS